VDDIFTLVRAAEIVDTVLDYRLVWRGEVENDVVRAFADVVRELGPLPTSTRLGRRS
jgi:hypothetical protein